MGAYLTSNSVPEMPPYARDMVSFDSGWVSMKYFSKRNPLTKRWWSGFSSHKKTSFEKIFPTYTPCCARVSANLFRYAEQEKLPHPLQLTARIGTDAHIFVRHRRQFAVGAGTGIDVKGPFFSWPEWFCRHSSMTSFPSMKVQPIRDRKKTTRITVSAPTIIFSLITL